MGWSDEDVIEDRIARIETLEREQEQDRQEYNCAVANGLIGKARRINRRMNDREREIRVT
jgi:hypothetical protein